MIFQTFVEPIIIYTTSACINIAILVLTLIRVFRNGIGILKVKQRTSPPSYILDSKWGMHGYIHLKERGIRLHYVEKGDARNPLIVFLHGFPECWLTWRHQLEEFSSKFRVIALDLRGYGDSDKPKSASEYTIHKISEDVKHFILELGVKEDEKCTIIGHDWGGVIAWKVVEDNPQLFKRHVSINGPQRGVKNEVLRSSLQQYKKAWYIFFLQFPFLPELLIRVNDYELLQQNLRGPNNRIDAFSDDVMEGYKYYWYNDGLKYPILYYKASFSEVIEIPPKKIDVPTLIIWGKEDQALSEELPKKMTKLCSDVQLKWVEGGSHFVHEEEPVYVNQLIWDYISITD